MNRFLLSLKINLVWQQPGNQNVLHLLMMRHSFTYKQCAFNFVNKKQESKDILDKLKIFRKKDHDHQIMIEETY